MKKTGFILCLGLVSSSAFAFPDMIRHGYVNCTTCHVSPSGGGMLTLYGRELSKEALSAASGDNEPQFAHGLVTLPEWLNMGGDLRGLLLFRDSASATSLDLISMQADLEAGITFKSFTLVGTGGYVVSTSELISRRHYLLFNANDFLSFRAGRFQKAYGINTPEHATSIKRGLGWDQGTETYNLEGAWISENWSAFAGVIIGRPTDSTYEKGANAMLTYSPSESAKIGVSFYRGSNDLQSRTVLGPHAQLGFSPRWYLLTELDFQFLTTTSTGVSKTGFANYQKLGYEWTKGFQSYVTQEWRKLDFGLSTAFTSTYGIGANYHPRPHFELSLDLQTQSTAGSSTSSLIAFLQTHYYF